MKIYYHPKLKQLARNLRKHSTMAEVLLWNRLKRKQMMGYQFLRQKAIGDYIVDLFCPRLHLVIEIDGVSHFGHENRDKVKQSYLESIGLTVLRFDDIQVKQNLEEVIQSIENWIKTTGGD